MNTLLLLKYNIDTINKLSIMKLNMDEDTYIKTEEETNKNIIETINDLILSIYNKNIQNIEIIKLDNDNIKTDNIYFMLHEALHSFIYYDKELEQWFMTNYDEPNHRILNCLKKDLSLNIFLVGNKLSYLVKDKHITNLFHDFKNIYHIDNISVNLFNIIKEKTNEYDFSYLENLSDDLNKTNVFILDNEFNFNFLLELIRFFYHKDIIDIYIKNNQELYKVNYSSGDIIIKKVNKR